MPLEYIAQAASPFFKLPAEIRIAVYEYLDLPPVDDWQCHGFIFSCRKAKRECEDLAIASTKDWLRVYKRDVLSHCSLGVRVLLPFPTRTPTGRHTTFHTLRNLTLVLPGYAMLGFLEARGDSFESLRPLNAIFRLWLDNLTLHFCGPLNQPQREWSTEKQIQSRVRRLVFVLESGFRYAHDPVGQRGTMRLNKHHKLVSLWQPEPVFMRNMVVSWDLTEQGLRSDDLIAVEGQCNKRPTVECPGMRCHYVSGNKGLLGEYSKASTCRFRLSDFEDCLASPSSEHKMTCLSCKGEGWDYRRYIRGLPTEDDERWL